MKSSFEDPCLLGAFIKESATLIGFDLCGEGYAVNRETSVAMTPQIPTKKRIACTYLLSPNSSYKFSD